MGVSTYGSRDDPGPGRSSLWLEELVFVGVCGRGRARRWRRARPDSSSRTARSPRPGSARFRRASPRARRARSRRPAAAASGSELPSSRSPRGRWPTRALSLGSSQSGDRCILGRVTSAGRRVGHLRDVEGRRRRRARVAGARGRLVRAGRRGRGAHPHGVPEGLRAPGHRGRGRRGDGAARGDADGPGHRPHRQRDPRRLPHPGQRRRAADGRHPGAGG